MNDCVALIVAAGRGERAAGPGNPPQIPKQYWPLAGKPVLRHTVEAFLPHFSRNGIFVVIRAEDRARYDDAAGDLIAAQPITGGPARQDSVRCGLEAIAAQTKPDKVLIHDAARPLVSPAVIARVIEGLNEADAVAPMIRVSDTLRRKTGDHFSLVAREHLFRTQTPQGFRFSPILEAHRRYAEIRHTDDIALAERAGLRIASVDGEQTNLKLTVTGDFDFAHRLASQPLADVRTGTGYDVHRFAKGDHVRLCGIRVPHEFGLEGYSDADAGLHALTDALLGAICAGDIGSHFPPTDERWRAASSHIFLEHAAALVRGMGGMIAHADVTLICERPKIAPHRESMRQRIAGILAI